MTCGFVVGLAGLEPWHLRLKPSSDADCPGVGMPDLGGIVRQCSLVSAAGGGDSFSSRTRCLEDQANASGVVRDVGIVCPLTRCRPGLTGMVATRSGYRRGRRSVLAILPTGAPGILVKGAVKPGYA